MRGELWSFSKLAQQYGVISHLWAIACLSCEDSRGFDLLGSVFGDAGETRGDTDLGLPFAPVVTCALHRSKKKTGAQSVQLFYLK